MDTETSTRTSGRESAWLELLRHLTLLSPHWLVWKGAESALYGFGDVDSTAPTKDWPRITESFRSWAFRHGLGPVIVCPHAPNVLFLVALHPTESFIELDVVSRKIFLGSTLFVPEDLHPVAVTDDRGFRRLRAGAEGLLKLPTNGARRNGLPNIEGLRSKRIPELLASDPDGVVSSAYLFGPARRAIGILANAVVRGGWDTKAMLSVQAWFLARGLFEPLSVIARVRFRSARRNCPLLRASFAGRRVPANTELWLREVERRHTVYRDPGPEVVR
jgi:hypothetical protein